MADDTFDRTKALAAADALRDAARLVHAKNTARKGLAKTARHDWEGPHHVRFERELKKVLGRGHTLASRLNHLAGQIEQASTDATKAGKD